MTKNRRIDPVFASTALLACGAAGLMLWVGTRSVAQAAKPVSAAPRTATDGARTEPAPIPRLNLTGARVAAATEPKVEVPATTVARTSVPVTLPGSEPSESIEVSGGDDAAAVAGLSEVLQARMSFVSASWSLSFAPATVPTFTADFDGSGELGPDDIADFLADFYSGSPSEKADFDHDGDFTPDDVAAFVRSYFDGEQTMQSAPMALTLMLDDNSLSESLVQRLQDVQFSFEAQDSAQEMELPQETRVQRLGVTGLTRVHAVLSEPAPGVQFRVLRGAELRVLGDQVGPATPAPAPR